MRYYYIRRERKVGEVMFEMWWRNGIPYAARRTFSDGTISLRKL